jgi:hypothetical protein
MEISSDELEEWKKQNEKFIQSMGNAYIMAAVRGIPWFVHKYCLKCEHYGAKCKECAYQIERHMKEPFPFDEG